jgi:hypothetical protein
MRKITLLVAIACMALTTQVKSQCTPAAIWPMVTWAEPATPTVIYNGYLCQAHPVIVNRTGWEYYDGDGYMFKLVAGSDVTITIGNCVADPCELTVCDSTATAIGAGAFIPGAYAAAACPNSITFTAPYTGIYSIVFNTDGDCSTAGSTAVGTVEVVLNNPTVITNCTPIAGPVNDSICGAIGLTLNNMVSGDNRLAESSDADDAALTAAGYACFTPNNTLWYSYTPVVSDSVEVLFTTDPASNPLSGWFGVLSTTAASNPCTSALTYEGCYYGPLNATASGSGATADPYDGVIPTNETVINHIYLTGGTTYYFVVDGVAGGSGTYQFGINTIITGINQLDANSDLVSVYPSPASSEITISLNASVNNANVTIYNAVGGLVKTINNANGATKVDVSTFAKGIYTVKVTSNGKALTQRFTVIK